MTHTEELLKASSWVYFQTRRIIQLQKRTKGPQQSASYDDPQKSAAVRALSRFHQHHHVVQRERKRKKWVTHFPLERGMGQQRYAFQMEIMGLPRWKNQESRLPSIIRRKLENLTTGRFFQTCL
ncbi:hypothetical protein J437_LFUL010074 [Ladona fulva]|uniref:Uncharacterized protein n=1 Tax=Ladona fulva TaxID=123851 RepID=A0A8K0KE15_LADFU|nr:hypothetical protein J437_LFUL010074 [Ladona fulva]